MSEIENNPHQALIEEKVAEFKELGVGYKDSIEPILDVLPNIDHPELGTYSFEKWLTQTLQDTIDTIDTVAAEQRSSIKIDSSDMQKVGDHYWGGDYEPTYYELEKLTESMNEILQTKLKALDKTPLPDKE